MTKFGKIVLLSIVLIILISAVLFFYRGQIFKSFYEPTQTSLEEGVNVGNNSLFQEVSTNLESITEIVADNLQIPWGIAFLPDGDLLVTERPGTLKRIGKEGRSYDIKGVWHVGEGGLLGVAVHPDFDERGWIYLYFSKKNDDGQIVNSVWQYWLANGELMTPAPVLSGIPGAPYHDGGRIAFGPDGYLYITTGDAGNPESAQDINSLAGKILRIDPRGEIPPDNPFGNAVWSYGHRNPQGLAWDDKGRLWATEHGRSGIFSGYDELNLIEKGKNYGWPEIQGNETRIGMESPVAQSGSNETWAPAGASFWNGSIFFGGLRGESLYEAKIIGDRQVDLRVHFRNEFGRIRAVVLGPDGYLYITTSNTDGRGDTLPNDDKIIRINPRVFRD